MPPSDRKYVRQNLERALGHCDSIMEYLSSVGNAFIDKGKQISEDSSQWPEEYLVIIETIDALFTGTQTVRDAISQLRDTI